MIPSIKWFPVNLVERAAWYTNFNRVIQATGASLGLTAAELETIEADCEMLRFLARSTATLAAYDAAFQGFRRQMTEGGVGEVMPQFPDLAPPVPPVGSEPGIFERLDRIVKRIRSAANYTPETEASLGIVPNRYKLRKQHLEAELGPSIKVSTDPGNIVNVKFVRGAATGVLIETLVDNDNKWQSAGNFTRSPAELRIPQRDDKLPRRVQVRTRFIEGNNPVGPHSNIATVYTEP